MGARRGCLPCPCPCPCPCPRRQVLQALSQHQLKAEELQLLRPVASRGQKETKRQALKRALQLERAGLQVGRGVCRAGSGHGEGWPDMRRIGGGGGMQCAALRTLARGGPSLSSAPF